VYSVQATPGYQWSGLSGEEAHRDGPPTTLPSSHKVSSYGAPASLATDSQKLWKVSPSLDSSETRMLPRASAGIQSYRFEGWAPVRDLAALQLDGNQPGPRLGGVGLL